MATHETSSTPDPAPGGSNLPAMAKAVEKQLRLMDALTNQALTLRNLPTIRPPKLPDFTYPSLDQTAPVKFNPPGLRQQLEAAAQTRELLEQLIEVERGQAEVNAQLAAEAERTRHWVIASFVAAVLVPVGLAVLHLA